jgi:hypothetical protein
MLWSEMSDDDIAKFNEAGKTDLDEVIDAAYYTREIRRAKQDIRDYERLVREETDPQLLPYYEEGLRTQLAELMAIYKAESAWHSTQAAQG